MSQENRERCQKERKAKRQSKPFAHRLQGHTGVQLPPQVMVQEDRNMPAAGDREMRLGLSQHDED